MWSLIVQKLKEIFSKMIGSRTLEQTLHISPIISSEMETAIQLWSDMYKGNPPWVHEPTWEDPSRVVSLGIPALIASEKARTALLEFSSEVTTPIEEVEIENPNYVEPQEDELGNILPSTQPKTIKEEKPVGNTERADFLNENYKRLKKRLRTQIEYGVAKGGLAIKPYVVKRANKYSFEFDYIQADSFYPLAFDNNGLMTEAAFLQVHKDKDYTYTRVEYHKWEDNVVTVVNRAFKSTSNVNNGTGVDLGMECSLSEVNEWKELQSTATIKNVDRPMFAYFKMPEANTIDTTSPLGVSGYSRAVDLIKDADQQYSRLLWEYEGGEMAIDVDRDALSFVTDSAGNEHTVLPSLQRRLFRKIDLGDDSTYQQFAPALRDAQYIQGLNAILMRIEDVTGLSRGTLSDVTIEAKTATELKMLKQRSYQTNEHIQKTIQATLEDVVYVMNAYCDLYNITPDGEYEISFEWDDSLITDKDDELGKRITLQQNGLASRVENRMWYFGETERQAVEALAKIDEENAKQAMTNMELEQQMTQVHENNNGNTTGMNNETPNRNQPNKIKGVDKNKAQ